VFPVIADGGNPFIQENIPKAIAAGADTGNVKALYWQGRKEFSRGETIKYTKDEKFKIDRGMGSVEAHEARL